MMWGRQSGTEHLAPTWSNDRVFWWTRIVEVLFLCAIPGALTLGESLLWPIVQLAVLLPITYRIRVGRRRKWERRVGRSPEAKAA